MKTSIYIEDGDMQIVLTPESKWEKRVIEEFEAGRLEVHRGSFYECQGGWWRYGPQWKDEVYGHASGGDKSLMLRIRREVVE